jgi:histidyl-tRNA synthetase
MQIPNTPPKWTSDWFPEEYKVRKYIFDTWRRVCLSYGFEEYLGPLVESTDIWKAKSGEDVGGAELTQITNKDGEITDLAIRPEMTPTVTRMVSRKWKEIDKPIKWFSIANFYRNEKPQKWRNREFWQLNADIFGESSTNADSEILTLSLEIMRAFNAPAGSYSLKLNHRGLINDFFSLVLDISAEDTKRNLMRLLDKYAKLKKEVFAEELEKLGLSWEQEVLEKFMLAKTITDLQEWFVLLAWSESFTEFTNIMKSLESLGYSSEIEFSGDLIRGFDYYDGIIFEMFDNNPDNPRALFGGWRYNGLAKIFGVKEDIPAIGFAPGDETTKLFLEGHGLLKDIQNSYSEKYYFPLLDSVEFYDCSKIANILRLEWRQVNLWLSVKKLPKAIKYADKNNYSHIIILGQQEFENNSYTIKNLKTGEEENISL